MPWDWAWGKKGLRPPTPRSSRGSQLGMYRLSRSVAPRGSQEVLGYMPAEEEEITEASEESRASDRDCTNQALERAMGQLADRLEACTGEDEEDEEEEQEEEQCLYNGNPKPACPQAGATLWHCLCRQHKKHLRSAKEGLAHEEKGNEEEDNSLKRAPGIPTFRLPLYKTFRSTDTVRFVEWELKKPRLLKMGRRDDQELLTGPEAGAVGGQPLLREVDETGDWVLE